MVVSDVVKQGIFLFADVCMKLEEKHSFIDMMGGLQICRCL